MAELPPLVIRCDASSEIGLGHLMRCRAIALEAGRERKVLFATCDDPSNPLLHDQDAPVERKREGEQEEEFLSRVCRMHAGSTVLADLYHPYAEHYLLDLARHCSGIVLLDTVCPGLPAADRVIYPAAHLDIRLLDGLIPIDRRDRVLEGPEYVVIRQEVQDLCTEGIRPEGEEGRLAVTTGGSDPAGVLLQFLPWLADYATTRPVQVDILVGEAFSDHRYLAKLAWQFPDNVRVQKFNPDLLARCQVALATFGVTIYELLYLGKQTVCVSHNRENAAGAKILVNRLNGILDAGFFEELEKDHLFRLLDHGFEKARTGVDLANPDLDGNGAVRIARVLATLARDKTGELAT